MARYRRLLAIAAAVTGFVLGAPAAVLAEDTTVGDTETEPAHEHLSVESVESVLPVLGAPLQVTVTLDDSGAIAEVALDSGIEPVRENEHRVVYELVEDETYALVKAGPHRVTTKVKSDSLEDVTGQGRWAADVFGTGMVTIPYTVGIDGEGNPTVTVGAVAAPAGVAVVVGDAKARGFKHLNGARQVVFLSSGDEKAWVVIRVVSWERDDGTAKASLSVSLISGHRHHHRHGFGLGFEGPKGPKVDGDQSDGHRFDGRGRGDWGSDGDHNRGWSSHRRGKRGASDR